MKKNIFVALLFVTFLLVSGCGKMATKFMVKVHNKSYYYTKLTNHDKEVLYFPMIHLNKPEYYKTIKNKVDSLREIGYKVYFESVGIYPNSQLDSLQKETIFKKFRKLVGFVPMDYFTEDNQQFKQLKVKGYVMQTAKNTGINLLEDTRADLPIDALVNLYEKEKGKITLNECDIQTKIGKPYKCQKTNRGDFIYLLQTLRDENLAEVISNSKDAKIVVLFGADHADPLIKNLKKKDSSWTSSNIHLLEKQLLKS